MFTAERRNYRIATRNLATRNLAALTPPVVAALIGAAEQRTSPLSGINMHHFHGAATRIPVTSTSSACATSISWWRSSARARRRRRRRPRVGCPRRPGTAAHAMPGGYPNLLGSDAADQIRHAYGPNAPRLIEVKKQYDPGNVFSAIPLPRR